MSSKNEKVLYTVLRKISNDRQFIIDAFRNWSKDQKDLSFEADDLVEYFESKIGFDANEKRNFRIAFYAINSREESALSDVPELLKNAEMSTQKLNGDVSAAVPKASNLKPEEKTFQAFLGVLLDLSKRHDADADVDMIDHFQDRKSLKAMKLGKKAESQLNRWIDAGMNQPFQTESLAVNEMKALFHQVYISLCESLGPVKADQVLNQSIGKVEQLNTGFSVSNLI